MKMVGSFCAAMDLVSFFLYPLHQLLELKDNRCLEWLTVSSEILPIHCEKASKYNINPCVSSRLGKAPYKTVKIPVKEVK